MLGKQLASDSEPGSNAKALKRDFEIGIMRNDLSR